MKVQIGNDHAIEGYRDPEADDPQEVLYRKVDGQRITESVFPEGTGILEAFNTAIAALVHHIEEGQKPAWVESDNDTLTAMFREHWDLSAQQTRQPKGWGEDA